MSYACISDLAHADRPKGGAGAFWRRKAGRRLTAPVEECPSPGIEEEPFKIVGLQDLVNQAPPSPLEHYIEATREGRQLRTGYSALYQFLPEVDRSAASEFRQLCRSEQHVSQTSGFAPGFVQANFVALAKEYAFDFLSFVLRNPKACPLLAVTDPGDPCPSNVARDADLRTDIPKYRVYRHGEVAEELTNITALWDNGMVGFLLGCSFSWEHVLKEEGLCPRQIEQGTNVPMFRTNLPNTSVGPFKGTNVVSMRPYIPENIAAVAEITAGYPGAHGGPIHWGDPADLGISMESLEKPDWGDAVEVRQGELPVFWACGVTPQSAIQDAKLPLVVTHAPGHMFICDVQDQELKVVVSRPGLAEHPLLKNQRDPSPTPGSRNASRSPSHEDTPEFSIGPPEQA